MGQRRMKYESPFPQNHCAVTTFAHLAGAEGPEGAIFALILKDRAARTVRDRFRWSDEPVTGHGTDEHMITMKGSAWASSPSDLKVWANLAGIVLDFDKMETYPDQQWTPEGFKDGRPTLAKWLKSHKSGKWAVHTRGHILPVLEGVPHGYFGMRMRVDIAVPVADRPIRGLLQGPQGNDERPSGREETSCATAQDVQ